MAATTTTIAALVGEIFSEGVSTLYRNDELMRLFPIVDQAGDVPRWVAHYAGQTGEEFSEGAAAPAAGNQSYLDATGAWRYFRVIVQVTGHAQDRLRSGNAVSGFGPALAEEMSRGQRDLVHLVTTSLLDTSAGGIQGIVDNSGTVYGIDRSTYTWWQSVETAVGGALTLNNLQTLSTDIRNQPRRGKPDLLIAAPNQLQNYINLVTNGTNTLASIVRAAPASQTIGNLDIGYAPTAVAFQGAPIVEMPNLTNTVWLMLDSRWWQIKRIRDIQVKPLSNVGDEDTYQISTALNLCCRNPYLQGKLTGVTA